MKNSAKLFGIIALAAVMAFAMTSCNNGTGGGSPPSGDPTSVKYLSYDGDGNMYELEIKAAGKAAYSPKGGDSYTLTITFINGNVVISTGTVKSVNGSSIELQHSGGGDFTVTVSSDNGVDTIISFTTNTGIPVDGYTEPVQKPAGLTPTKPGNNEENPQLPDPIGTNELSGKTYDNGFFIISFGADSSYNLSYRRGSEPEELLDTGFYSWNTDQKTVILALDKTSQGYGDFGIGLQSKSEIKASSIEYLLSLPAGDLQLPQGTTIEQYVDGMIEILFSLATYDYKIESGEIAYFGIKITLADTGTAIAGCAYSTKAATEAFGTHYLLSISFDDALAILTAAYGQPDDMFSLQAHSTLTNGADWVILEFTRYKDMRLIKNESNETTTKGWFLNLP